MKLFCSSSKNEYQDINRAKQLYFANFANHITMKKNGEFNEYQKYNIPVELEHKWSLEIKDNLIADIASGQNLLSVVPLSRVNLPQDTIIDAFQVLAASPNKSDILKTIHQLARLFDPNIYNQICILFM